MFCLGTAFEVARLVVTNIGNVTQADIIMSVDADLHIFKLWYSFSLKGSIHETKLETVNEGKPLFVVSILQLKHHS